MNIEHLKRDWSSILRLPVVKDGCRRTHANSLPLSIQGNMVRVIADDNTYSNHLKYQAPNVQQLTRAISDFYREDLRCEILKWQTIFPIDEDDLSKCVGFALNSMTHMTNRDFQQVDIIRSPEDFVIDTVEGKLSELVLQKFIHRTSGLSFYVDLNIYPKSTETDGGNDLLIICDERDSRYLSNLKVDIKATKEKNQWLLVEQTKAMADVYVLVRMKFEKEDFLGKNLIDFEHISDPAYREHKKQQILRRFNNDYQGEIAGFAYMTDIVDPVKKQAWLSFSRATENTLLHTQELENLMVSDPTEIKRLQKEYADILKYYKTPLKAETNYGIPSKYLRTSCSDWGRLLQQIQVMMIPWNDQIYPSRLPRLLNRTEEEIQQQVHEVERNLHARRNPR